MLKLLPKFNSTQKGIRIFWERLRAQGVRTTLVWFYGRGIPAITGSPLMKHSRITPQIYVGPQYSPRGKRKLERMGISYGVNLRAEFDDAAHDLDLMAYCYLPTVDDEAPSMNDMDRGVAFIHEAVTNGGKVYIHCAGGVGRAPTMAIAYFISQGINLNEAIALVRKSRPFIFITEPQMERLKQYDRSRA